MSLPADSRPVRRGRGARQNPDGRYLDIERELVDDGWGDNDYEPPKLTTTVTPEKPKKIINHNTSPDIPFVQSINPYRGCEHGCAYCYARPAHAYVDLSPGLDFESRLFYKRDAARLLRAELRKRGYICSPISLGANTDSYQPIERRYKVTRSIIELFAECNHPFTIVSKSSLVERDLDLIAPMAAKNLVQVFISVTTLDRQLARRMEPRAAAPQRRLKTLEALAAAGVPAGVMFAPVVPALNDAEMESVLAAAAASGAQFAGYVILRLPREVNGLFQDWLNQHYPLKAGRVMARVRDTHDGKESDTEFGRRLKGTGVFAELIAQRFRQACARFGLDKSRHDLDTSLFTPPKDGGPQMELF